MPQTEQDCFEKEWIDACPAGLLVIDSGGTIRWLNPALEEMLGLDADRLLGHNRGTLPEPAYRGLFDEDTVISLPGPGERWFHRESASVRSADGDESTLYVYRDISELVHLRAERDRLQEQVQDLTLTDELTGLANRRALIDALTTQVTRSRRYHNPLSLMVVRVTLGDSKTLAIHELPERAVLAVSHYLRDRLRWADIIGRYDRTLFMLILPETDQPAAGILIEKIRAESTEIELPDDLANLPLELSFGLAEWKQGDDPRTLTERAMLITDTENGAHIATSNGH